MRIRRDRNESGGCPSDFRRVGVGRARGWLVDDRRCRGRRIRRRHGARGLRPGRWLALGVLLPLVQRSYQLERAPRAGCPRYRGSATGREAGPGEWALGAAAGSLLTGLSPLRGWALFVGALASAQADTWATEIGAHAPRRPRLITTGREVPRGTSGRVTALGSLGGLAGGISIMGACLHGRGTNQEPRRRGHRWRCRLAERFRIRGYDPGAFPMPGMRTGYGASHSSLRRQEQATGRLALVRQRRSQLCVHCGRRGVGVGVSLRSLATAAYARPEERP